MGGHCLIAAAQKNTGVKGSGVGVDFDQIGDGIAGSQGIVNTVVALGHAVANIGCKITRSAAARFTNSGGGLITQLQQVGAAGMAIAEGAFHQYLRFRKIGDTPPHA